jgi:hypothetical protein
MNPDDPNDPQISDQQRIRLKQLYSYAGSDLPDVVKRKAMKLSAMGVTTGWLWDNGGDFFQCLLHLCDPDAVTIDPAGYAAIRPLGESRYALEFCLGEPDFRSLLHPMKDALEPNLPPDFQPRLTFRSMLEAQRYLDTLLGSDTPQIPPFEAPFETA